MSDWLKELKQGDEVIDRTGHGYATYTLKKVARTTKTQIITDDGCRYRNENGIMIGNNSWSISRLCEPTEELREKVWRQRALQKLAGINWHNEPVDVLRAVLAAYKEAKGA